jgi:HAD superfamily hydrolase (TIGR01509 family)
MRWIERFDLFLFDFDGILVDTEPLHYAAFAQLLARRNIDWDWDFEGFCRESHGQKDGIKHALYKKFPILLEREPHFEVLAEEKRVLYTQLLQEQRVPLMPGVKALLSRLQAENRTHCVVTNSWREHVEMIRSRDAQLSHIPHWLTREDYPNPKPAPDGYQKAIDLYGFPGARVIGFEDTCKGFKALSQTAARAVLICPSQRSHVSECLALGGLHYPSFEEVEID